MKEYMMIFRNQKPDESNKPSAEQIQMVMQQWQTWIKNVVTSGKYCGTNRLLSEGKTIKPNNVISDGPYAEVKEVVGGYLIVKTNSLDEALEIAKSCPGLLYGGNVEVRSVMQVEHSPEAANFLYAK